MAQTASVQFTFGWSPQQYQNSPRRIKASPRAKSPRAPSPPRHSERIRRGVSLDKLVIRKSFALDSEKVGSLLMGKAVLVLEQQRLHDGTIRSRVGKESSPRGFAVDILGWITSVKGGEHKLVPIADEDDAENHFVRRQALPSFVAAVGSPDSMASRIAQRRLETRRFERPGSDYARVVSRLRANEISTSPRSPTSSKSETWLSATVLSDKAHSLWKDASAIEASVFDTAEEQVPRSERLLAHVPVLCSVCSSVSSQMTPANDLQCADPLPASSAYP